MTDERREGDVPAPARRVRGDIALPPGEPGERAAAVIVHVEDVSRADAPSRIVGEQRIEDVPLGADVPFEVEVPAEAIDERGMYTVSVHVDVSGSGEIERGDLITTESYPVLTLGHPDEAHVSVRRI